MKIAVTCPFEEPVPPKTYGGTELVVFNLIEELVALGHDVTLFAAGNSRVSCRIKPVFEVNLRQHPDGANPQIREALKFVGIGRVVEELRADSYDVVHNHIGWRMLPFSRCLNAPVITTLHGPLSVPNHAYMYNLFKDAAYVSISDAQRRPAPEMNFVATVYNGIDCSSFTPNDSPDDYFAFLGRISPEKGPIQAIEAARRTGVKLKIAAKIDTADQSYYEEAVKPLIDGHQIEFIGEVDHAGKNEVLRNARALLMPIQWEEPFGLVMIEALVCGCPVIANGRGSVPEVINSHVGFVTSNVDDICDAIKNLDNIDRQECHRYACERFDRSAMARNYVAAYERVMDLRTYRARV